MSARANLRTQQTALTRDLIMEALTDLIVDRGVQAFSVQQVAERAGVSHRTVYRHYPSRQALLDGLAEWLDERFARRLGSDVDDYKSMMDDLDSLARGVELSFAHMDEHATHMKAYVALHVGTGIIAARRKERTDALRATLVRGAAGAFSPGHRDAVVGLLRTLISSTTWHQMTTEHGLDGRVAGRSVAWAIQTLIADLEAGGGPALDEDGGDE